MDYGRIRLCRSYSTILRRLSVRSCSFLIYEYMTESHAARTIYCWRYLLRSEEARLLPTESERDDLMLPGQSCQANLWGGTDFPQMERSQTHLLAICE